MDAKKERTTGHGGKDPRVGRGRAGERLARLHLEERGYEILETNFRSRYGEIDLIARCGDVVAFIEVKARRSRRHGEPFEAVGHRKQGQIRRMAEMWVAARGERSLRECSFRFDVVSIMLDQYGGCAELAHIEDAFR